MDIKDFKPKPLNQQVIVITGATSGIGLATAEMAAKRGAKVVLSSRNEEALHEVCQRLGEAGCAVVGVRADVKNMTDLRQVRVAAESAFGGIDTWINNAGGSIYGPLLEIPEEEERELFERAIPLQGMYSASKHAVKAYTDALCMELEHDNVPIEVCLVRPTAIDTSFPDHAVNHLKNGEPSLPNPVYHPDYAAAAILKCAEDPERDVWVGAPSKARAIMEFLMPGLADKIALKTAYKKQSQGTNLPHDPAHEGLFHAPDFEGELRGHYKGKVKETRQMQEPHLTDKR